ncbi:MAG: DsbC family protein [Aquificaceae bacterium]|nr:DsbC family protein [Aquificaceae bacterium]
MRLLMLFFIAVNLIMAQDLYKEYIRSQVKDIPLKKAIVLGKGKKELISFINPDCGHCRKEWQAIKPHLDKVRVYIFLLPFKTFPESYAKSNYIACSKDKLKALDEVLSGKMDGRPLQTEECGLVQEHIKVAEKLNVQATPYNIVLGSYKVIEGYNPKLLEELGIR